MDAKKNVTQGPVVAKSPVRGGAVAAAANPFGSFNPFGQSDPFGFADPFAPARSPAADEVAADAPEGSYTYTLVKSTPDVPVEEVEDARASSVEVMILWDTTVLHVQHLTPPRSFFVGEGTAEGCDYFLSAEKLGATRAPIVLVDRGAVSVVVPRGATGTVEIAGAPKTTLQEALDRGRSQPCAELTGAYQIQLPPGSSAKVDVGGLVFQVSTGNAGRVVAGHFHVDSQGLLYTGVSLAVHAALLGAMAFFMPPLGSTDEDGISQEQEYVMKQYLAAAAEKEPEAKETESTVETNPVDQGGGTGSRAMYEEGKMGDTTSHRTEGHWANQGPADNQDLRIARMNALLDAGSFGAIGLLAGGSVGGPTAPWGAEEALGNNAVAFNGNMWGSSLGEAYGAGGLGLTGTGIGGGSKYEGIGLDKVGTIGGGAGGGAGDGFGHGHSHLSGTHAVGVPRVRMGVGEVSGRIPREVIQRIVRQNFGRFRLCYENGLRNSPNLQGRVAVRFVIGRDGAVSNVGNGGSDMPDTGVVSCVVRAFYGLSFPQPDAGIVTVTYPIMFAPGS